jgi:arginase
VLDPGTVGPANAYATPGGITADQLADAVGAVRDAADIEAITLSAYDPAHDPHGGVRAAVRRLFAT